MSASFAVSACDCGFVTATAERASEVAPAGRADVVTHAR